MCATLRPASWPATSSHRCSRPDPPKKPRASQTSCSTPFWTSVAARGAMTWRCSCSSRRADMAVLEICTFTLSAGALSADAMSADEAAMRAADERMQTDFAYQQQGLRRRTTARDDEGRWCVVSLWTSRDEASAAEEAAKTNEVAQNFWSLVDPESVSVQRFTLL